MGASHGAGLGAVVLPGQADGRVEPRTDVGRLYDGLRLDERTIAEFIPTLARVFR